MKKTIIEIGKIHERNLKNSYNIIEVISMILNISYQNVQHVTKKMQIFIKEKLVKQLYLIIQEIDMF